jgi:hypothetical protein
MHRASHCTMIISHILLVSYIYALDGSAESRTQFGAPLTNRLGFAGKGEVG